MAQSLPLFVTVQGAPFTDIPGDLYIPPDYLEVLLDQFEGPLDLLLYLIRKKNFDLMNLPIGPITEQYLTYLEKFKKTRRDLALEYLVMAGTLIELKSRLLLPPPERVDGEEEEIDPRAQLIARLQAYEQCQRMSDHIDEQPRLDRDFFTFHRCLEKQAMRYRCDTTELHQAYQAVLIKKDRLEPHNLAREAFTLDEARDLLCEQLEMGAISWSDWLASQPPQRQHKRYQITFFLAMLELAKQYTAVILQENCFGPLLLMKAKEAPDELRPLS